MEYTKMQKLHIMQTLKQGFTFLLQHKIVFIPACISAFLSALLNSYILLYNPFILIPGGIISLFINCFIIRFIYERITGVFSWKRIFQITLCKILPILAATLLTTMIFTIGAIALIIPGIYLFFKLLFYMYAILLDNEGVISSLKKSWNITKGNWWMVFILSIIISLSFWISAIGWFRSNIFGMIIYFLVALFAAPWYSAVLVFAYLKLKDIQAVAPSSGQEKGKKLRWKLLTILVILAIVAGTLTLGGLYIYKKVKSAFTPGAQETIAQSIISYKLPDGYKLEMAMNMFVMKMALFKRNNSEQIVMLIEPAGQQISDGDFKQMILILKDGKASPADARAVDSMLKANGISDIKIIDAAEIDFAGEYKIPYAICTFTKNAKLQEGFWGVLNLQGSKRTIYIMDLAEPGKYNFELTKEFIEAFNIQK